MRADRDPAVAVLLELAADLDDYAEVVLRRAFLTLTTAGADLHTDRGSQYTSKECTALLAGHESRQSWSRPRQCWNNAVAGRWFATRRRELLYGRT